MSGTSKSRLTKLRLITAQLLAPLCLIGVPSYLLGRFVAECSASSSDCSLTLQLTAVGELCFFLSMLIVGAVIAVMVLIQLPNLTFEAPVKLDRTKGFTKVSRVEQPLRYAKYLAGYLILAVVLIYLAAHEVQQKLACAVFSTC